MNKKAIFSTSWLQHPSYLARSQQWLDYYTAFFKGTGTDLYIINDGPAIDFDPRCTVIGFPEHLGRPKFLCVAGWKRSFWTGLKLSEQYAHLGHIESDCWVLPLGRDEFLEKMNSPNYYVADCVAYGFPETSLQILNDKSIIDHWINRYATTESWFEEINVEMYVRNILKPIPFLKGGRFEGVPTRIKPDSTYVSQALWDAICKYVLLINDQVAKWNKEH